MYIRENRMKCRRISFLICVVVLVLSSFSIAAPAVQSNLSDQALWSDAMYYLKVGRFEYGRSYLQAYADRKINPVKTLKFAEKDPRGVQILIKLQNDPKLGPLAKSMLDMVDKGWQKKRKDPAKIQAEIERLAGNARAQFHATERLKESGEYAIPIILENLANPKKKYLYAKLIDTIVAIGPEGIEPELAGLPNLSEKPKLALIEALGRMDYSQALPYLKELVESPKASKAVRSSATLAIDSICTRNPKYRTDEGPAESFYKLAKRYYYHDSAVQPGGQQERALGLSPDVRAKKPNIWIYRNGKLKPVATPWEIYYELMTMRLCRHSLQLDTRAGQRGALTLWLMANCKRASRLSGRVKDPIHKSDFPSSAYFYRSAGTQYSLDSLAGALRDGDIAISIASLDALREVASGNDILASLSDIQPIVAALNHKNQLIRLAAALAIGWSAPGQTYPGIDSVVPLLAKNLSGPAKPVTVVLIPGKKKRNMFIRMLDSLGYNAKGCKDFEAASNLFAKDASAIELIILDVSLKTPSAEQAISQARENPLLKLVPVVVLADSKSMNTAKIVLAGKSGLAIIPDTSNSGQLSANIKKLNRLLGRVKLSKAQKSGNAMLAAKALEKLAEKNLSQYDVTLAIGKLTKTLAGNNWPLARQCAKVLSILSSQSAQQNLADSAITQKQAGKKITLLNLLTASVRSFGDKLTDKQASKLQSAVIKETKSPVRIALAKLLGAMNLKPVTAKKVILAKEHFGQMK